MKFPKFLAASMLVLAASVAIGGPSPQRVNNTVLVGDGAATLKWLKFDIGAGASNPLIQSTSGGVLQLSTDGTNLMTVPAATDTFVGKATTDTLTNKTLTAPGITAPTVTGSGTITTATNIVDPSTTSKKLAISLSGATAAKTMTLSSSHTDDRTLTLPDASDTLVGKATTDTLTNKTIGSAGLSFAGSSSGATILKAASTASGTITMPASTDTMCVLSTSQTLSNKTLSSPTITGAFTADNNFTATRSSGLLYLLNANGSSATSQLSLRTGNGTTSGRHAFAEFDTAETSGQTWDIGLIGSQNLDFYNQTLGRSAMNISPTNNMSIGDNSLNNGTAALRVNADSNGGGGSTPLFVMNYAATPGGSDIGIEIRFQNGGTSTTGQYIRFEKNGGTATGGIAQNGSTSTAYNTSSDARLKHDVEDFDDGLDILRRVHVRKFRWNDGDAEDRGVIAQELKKVYPFPVWGEPDGDVNKEPMSVDYGKLSPLALSAAKQIDKNEQALEAKVISLVDRLEKAEARIAELESEKQAAVDGNGHAIITDGLNKTVNGKVYLHVKNSWGERGYTYYVHPAKLAVGQ